MLGLGRSGSAEAQSTARTISAQTTPDSATRSHSCTRSSLSLSNRVFPGTRELICAVPWRNILDDRISRPRVVFPSVVSKKHQGS